MGRIKETIKKIDRKGFNLLPRFKRAILRIKPVNYYIEKSEYFVRYSKFSKATLTLKKGLKYYPKNFYLNKQLAILETDYGTYQTADIYWSYVIKKHPKKMEPEDYIKAFEVKSNIHEKSLLNVMKKSLKQYPNDIMLLKETYSYYLEMCQWKSVIECLSNLYSSHKYKFTYNDYINLSISYFENKHYNRAEYVAQQGLRQFPTNEKIILHYIDITIKQRKWEKSLHLIKKLNDSSLATLSKDKKRLFGMIFQLNGNLGTSNYLYEESLENHSDNVGHKELIIFDNGETRITFFKSPRKTNKVIVTFDSIYMTWDNPSFAYKLLSRQNIDIIAVQKRQKKKYHQDLSLETFVDVVGNLVKNYQYKYSYGFSLGAYSALYYCSVLDFTILALAPRLSIHPIYGRKKEIGSVPFLHRLRLKSNNNIKPIIVYDPKDKIDSAYVEKEVLDAIPNAYLIKANYGGHGIAPHLLRMGLLKKFILTVILEDKNPDYEQEKRSLSANYCRLLGNKCLKRNKVNWANEFADRAYELLPENSRVIMFRVDVYIKMKKFSSAEILLKNSIKLKPKNISFRLRLLDVYILENKLISADRELKITEDIFGSKPQIVNKKRKLDKAIQKTIETL